MEYTYFIIQGTFIMGQYYKAVNLSKKQYMESDCFLKLTETAFINNHYVGGSIMTLLLDEPSKCTFLKSKTNSKLNPNLIGQWSMDHIVFAGDYADAGEYCLETDIMSYKKEQYPKYLEYQKEHSINEINRWLNNTNLYDLCGYSFKELNTFMKKSISNSKLFLVNHTKNEFISLENYINQDGIANDDWITHPLPILLAQSNERGGGDYYGINKEIAGKWCGDKISTSFFQPYWYSEFLPFFRD